MRQSGFPKGRPAHPRILEKYNFFILTVALGFVKRKHMLIHGQARIAAH
jgi:hypothetical protein